MMQSKFFCQTHACVIIPLFNEVETIDELYTRLCTALLPLCISLSVCLIDDGSSDGTLDKIQQISSTDPRFSYISFSRNFGHQSAIVAGLRENRADIFIVMDGDLQDPPEVIPQMIALWEKGNQVVYGVRVKRRENILKRALYHGFYRFLHAISSIDIPLDAGDFCLMDRRVVEQLNNLREHNVFLRGLRRWVGFKQIGLEYERPKRFDGKSKYSLLKLVKLAYDGIISFSFAPLKIAVNMGFVVSFFAFMGILYLLVQKIFFRIPMVGWTSTFVLILFVGGVQLFTMGIIGEYLARIFDEMKGRPLYIIKEQHVNAQASPNNHRSQLNFQSLNGNALP